MYIFFKKYNNSALATVISLIGSAFIFLSLYLIVDAFISKAVVWDELLIFICMALIGIGMRFWAKHIYEKKILKTLKKNIQKQNMEANIRTSTELAVAIYNKAPYKPVQKYISELNPAAGEIIKQNKAAKK